MDYGIGESAQKGTPFINVKFQLTDSGFTSYWKAYLTENTMERVIDTLVTAKLLRTRKFADIANGPQSNSLAMDQECEVVVVNEEYEKDGETKVAAKIEFVNPVGGRKMQGTLDKATAVTKLAGLNLDAEILASTQRTGIQLGEKEQPKTEPQQTDNFTADDIPF